MLRFLLAFCAAGALGPAILAQQPAPRYRIEATDHQTVIATMSYEIRTERSIVSRWMVFIPEPPNLPSQAVTRVTSHPKGKVVVDKSLLARKVRFIDRMVRDPMPGGGLTIRQEVEATLRRRELVPLGPGEVPPKVTPLTPTELKYYTSATPQIDIDARAFRDWLAVRELRAKKDEQPLELAARTLDAFRADLTYRYETGDEKCASRVCVKKVGDCASLANLLVAVMRANKVPARALVGRLAQSRLAGSRLGDAGHDHPHVRAEVFVLGMGWVPIDPTMVLMDKTGPVADFIGKDPGDLLVMHVGGDLKLPFPDRERTADMLQVTPFYWTVGNGPLDVFLASSGWEVKVSPVGKK